MKKFVEALVKEVTAEPIQRNFKRITFNHATPKVSNNANVSQTSVLIGRVNINDRAQILGNCVLRGETDVVEVGMNSKIFSGSVLSAVDKNNSLELPKAVKVGSNCVIGSDCVLNSCILEDDVVLEDKVVVGAGAIVQKGAKLGKNTVIPPGKLVPAGTEWGFGGDKGAIYVGEVSGGH